MFSDLNIDIRVFFRPIKQVWYFVPEHPLWKIMFTYHILFYSIPQLYHLAPSDSVLQRFLLNPYCQEIFLIWIAKEE